ncbi:uncharacterized protein LOC126749058 [Anthonomus grandis grandis]|uniref:uncharacterized protein LOC126749058 n=1 Tax=Anthonomus grandis grandis TaxID=2921223 RepID=UPI002166BED4|nr:uncharacterized protein LOC126749058 [Anthonomus grandis grandis]
MEGFLRVDSNAGTSSPSFNLDNADATSICPLITPSPPTNALVDPQPEPKKPSYQIGEELAEKLQKVHDKGDVDSISSASSSELPASSQLLEGNNFLGKPIDEEVGAEGGKVTPLELTFRNPIDDYFFTSWNWPLIRKVSLYFYISALIGMVALVVGLIATLPKTCNPPTEWHQGNLFYEIFPASFYSSQQRSKGDLKGIALRADYLMRLGVRGVRLNPIFTSPDYPNDSDNPLSLIEIDRDLGTIEDFKKLVKDLNSRNISLILDLPVSSFIEKPAPKKVTNKIVLSKNGTEEAPDLSNIGNDLSHVDGALEYWRLHGVKGFYLKGLETHAAEYQTARLLRRWKKLIQPNQIFIVSEEVINLTPKENINIVLNNVDLVDVKLDIEKGVARMIAQIDAIQNGTLFSKPGMPWVHWSIGNMYSPRVASVIPHGNPTLGVILLQMMLPGTPSIFYGDELGLHDISDPHKERQDVKHLHQLTMMPWKGVKESRVLPWMYGGKVIANFEQIDAIMKMVELRSRSPSIYMNAVYKQGVNKANAEVKYTKGDFVAIQRWYPRRKSYVVASNLGSRNFSADLSLLLYTGQVVVGPKVNSTPEEISFKQINLFPGESVVIVLD